MGFIKPSGVTLRVLNFADIDNKSEGLQFVSPPHSGTISASYGTKAPGMYTSVKSILGGTTAVPGRKAIANLCLFFASPVAADNTSAAVVEKHIVASGYKLSLGLVEISALATLIGATNAEALALGMGAAAGLPWASISTFGAVNVIKVSLAAVMSDRIREALGLRNQTVDSAIGMSL